MVWSRRDKKITTSLSVVRLHGRAKHYNPKWLAFSFDALCVQPWKKRGENVNKYRKSYGFEFNLELICASEFYQQLKLSKPLRRV